MNKAVTLDIGDYLQSHDIFRHMSNRLTQILADAGRLIPYKQGEHLFRQDQPANNFYIVVSGRVSVEIPSIYGPPLIVQTLGEGDVLGWSWLIAPYRWTFEAISETETRVIEFNGETLRKTCDADPELGYQLMKCFAGLMSERLHEARTKMMETWSAPGFA